MSFPFFPQASTQAKKEGKAPLLGLVGAIYQHTENTPVVSTIRAFKDGQEAKAESKEELFKLYKEAEAANELFKLHITIIAHRQGRNANHWRIKAGSYRKIAKSFAGKVFQRNHRLAQQDRGGTILSSKVVGSGEEAYIVQEIELTEPWAIEGYLRGSVDRFSIQLNTHDLVGYCTICGASIWEYCPHWPGRTYDTDKGEQVCEFVMHDGSGKETSAVTDPAVEGTGAIQQFAASIRGINLPLNNTSSNNNASSKEKTMDPEELIEQLKAEKTSLEEKIAAHKKDVDSLRLELKAEKDNHKQTKEELEQSKQASTKAQKERDQIRASVCNDLAGRIKEVRASAIFEEDFSFSLPEDADSAKLQAEEDRLRRTLLASQIIQERSWRNTQGEGLNVKAEEERLLGKSAEVLAEVLAEARSLPKPPQFGKGSHLNPSEDPRKDKKSSPSASSTQNTPETSSGGTVEIEAATPEQIIEALRQMRR